MAFAIVDIAGTQHKVSCGSVVRVPVLSAGKGDKIKFDKLLLVANKSTKVGMPHVDGSYVDAKVVDCGRSKKIRVFTMKHRKRCRRTQGHRQAYMDIEILKISG